MIKRFLKCFGFLVFFIFLILSAGCAQKDSDFGNEVLIRVGDRVVTVLDFNKAFEIAETAYSHNIRQQSEEIRKAKLSLLNQMTVEMIFLERAEELGIAVTDAELQKAVADIKSDYPEGEFEKTLLEFAVTYDSWESRLMTRLLMQKVIDQELKNQIAITPEDIAEYLKENYIGNEMDPESGATAEDINETIVNQLREKKAEDAYKVWLDDLKQKYAIEINLELWKKICGSQTVDEDEAVTENSKNG